MCTPSTGCLTAPCAWSRATFTDTASDFLGRLSRILSTCSVNAVERAARVWLTSSAAPFVPPDGAGLPERNRSTIPTYGALARPKNGRRSVKLGHARWRRLWLRTKASPWRPAWGLQATHFRLCTSEIYLAEWQTAGGHFLQLSVRRRPSASVAKRPAFPLTTGHSIAPGTCLLTSTGLTAMV